MNDDRDAAKASAEDAVNHAEEKNASSEKEVKQWTSERQAPTTAVIASESTSDAATSDVNTSLPVFLTTIGSPGKTDGQAPTRRLRSTVSASSSQKEKKAQRAKDSARRSSKRRNTSALSPADSNSSQKMVAREGKGKELAQKAVTFISPPDSGAESAFEGDETVRANATMRVTRKMSASSEALKTSVQRDEDYHASTPTNSTEIADTSVVGETIADEG